MVDEIYSEFLIAMQELENFRKEYGSSTLPVEKEDPETERLIEAMGFFLARTRLANKNYLERMHLRLFQQFFSYLLTPIPSHTMISLHPLEKQTECVTLSPGTEFTLKNKDEKKFYFQSLFSLTMFPVHKKMIEMQENKCTITIESLHLRKEPLTELRFFVYLLNNFTASSQLLYLLEKYADSAFISYDGNSETYPCQLDFTKNQTPIETKELFFHPIEEFRHSLAFPERDLFFTIKFPPSSHFWKKMTFTINLSKDWPKETQITNNSLHLFCLPLVNLKRAYASPINYTALQDSFPVLSETPAKEENLHSIKQVFTNEKIIKNSFLSQENESYEIENSQHDHILLKLKEEKTVSIDALWYQNSLKNHSLEIFKSFFSQKSLPYIQLTIEIPPTIPIQSGIIKNSDALLQLLTLKNTPILNTEAILTLLKYSTSFLNSPYKWLSEIIISIEGKKQISRLSVADTIHYTALFKQIPEEKSGVCLVFLKELYKLLDSWTCQGQVELTLNSPNLTIHFTQGEVRFNEDKTLVSTF